MLELVTQTWLHNHINRILHKFYSLTSMIIFLCGDITTGSSLPYAPLGTSPLIVLPINLYTFLKVFSPFITTKTLLVTFITPLLQNIHNPKNLARLMKSNFFQARVHVSHYPRFSQFHRIF